MSNPNVCMDQISRCMFMFFMERELLNFPLCFTGFKATKAYEECLEKLDESNRSILSFGQVIEPRNTSACVFKEFLEGVSNN